MKGGCHEKRIASENFARTVFQLHDSCDSINLHKQPERAEGEGSNLRRDIGERGSQWDCHRQREANAERQLVRLCEPRRAKRERRRKVMKTDSSYDYAYPEDRTRPKKIVPLCESHIQFVDLQNAL